jgi:hypothetical protein
MRIIKTHPVDAPIPLSTHSRSNRGRSSINTSSAKDGAKTSVCGNTVRKIALRLRLRHTTRHMSAQYHVLQHDVGVDQVLDTTMRV